MVGALDLQRSIQLNSAIETCVRLSSRDELHIEGIYLSVTFDGGKAKAEAPGYPFVQALPYSRLDLFDFSVARVLDIISPKIAVEIVVYLLAQRSPFPVTHYWHLCTLLDP